MNPTTLSPGRSPPACPDLADAGGPALPPPRVPHDPSPTVPLDRPAFIDFDPTAIIAYLQRKHHVAVGLAFAARNLLACCPYSRANGAAEAVARWDAVAEAAETEAAVFQARLSHLGLQALRYAAIFDPTGLNRVLELVASAGEEGRRLTVAERRLDAFNERLAGIDGALVALARRKAVAR